MVASFAAVSRMCSLVWRPSLRVEMTLHLLVELYFVHKTVDITLAIAYSK
jgi:hypothetical protein